jgi:hypothetical protein
LGVGPAYPAHHPTTLGLREDIRHFLTQTLSAVQSAMMKKSDDERFSSSPQSLPQ